MTDSPGAGNKAELFTAACGHDVTLTLTLNDPNTFRRIEKVVKRPCPACRARANNERQRKESLAGVLAGHKLDKGQALRLLPPGTVIGLQYKDDGLWHGALRAEGIEVYSQGETFVKMTSDLAKAWVDAKS